MNAKLIGIGDHPQGQYILPLPWSILKVLGWEEGDLVGFELVVDKQGNSTHIVLEKREK